MLSHKSKVKVKLDPSWHSRRLVIRLSLLSCLGLTIYSMLLGPSMASVVITPAALLAGSIIGSYVFGASYERVNGVQSLNEYSNYSESRSNYRQDTGYTRYKQRPIEPSSSSVDLITAALQKSSTDQ